MAHQVWSNPACYHCRIRAVKRMDPGVGLNRPVLSTAYANTTAVQAKPEGMIHATEIRRTALYVPMNNAQKPYEYVSGITDTTSAAWKVLHGKEKVTYEQDGTVSIDGYTAVAMGKSYGSPGDRFSIQLSTGKWIRVVIVDSKQYKDTKNLQGWQGWNDHILEMVVWSVPSNVQVHGSYDVLPEYKGKIVKIYREEEK